MNFPYNRIVGSEVDTEKVAIEFGKVLKTSDIVALSGDLGSGKTFFVKSVLRSFGIEDVTSPTFSIVNSYSGDVSINHFDFYRIKKVVELYDIGFEEYLVDESAITFIEWAEMYEEILPKNIYRINIKHIEDAKREITIGIE